MTQKTIFRLLAALIALMLMMPAALAEPGEDTDLSGYNPFAGDVAESASAVNEAASTNLFDNSAAAIGTNPNADPLATAIPAAADPFGTGTGAVASATVAPVVNDPFGVGGATQAPVLNDPFGVGTASVAATPAPEATIGGYNPFDPTAAPQAVQQTNAVMYVVAASAKLYKKADENSRRMGTLIFGDQVNVSATQGEWAQVTSPKGSNAYVRASDLSSANPNVLNKTMYAQLARVAVYKNPSRRSGRVKNLKKGDTITMVAITSDGLWCRVTDGTKYGFVPTVYLDDAPQATGTPVWCAAGVTAVMVNPESWIEISKLSFGQSVYLVGYTSNNTVAKIRSAKGYVAYCDASALSTANPATLSTPVYAQVTGRILSASASETGKHYFINKNNRLTLLGIDSSQYWALVKQGRRKLYVPYIFLGTSRLGKNYKVVVTNQDAPMYQGAEASSAVLATLPMGSRLYLTGIGESGAKVTTVSDGVNQAVTGYVPLQYLRSE